MKFILITLVVMLTLHQTIASDCSERLKNFDGKFLDALGKPGSGISEGNLKMYGNYDMCRHMANYTPCKTSSKIAKIPLLWTHCLPDECAANTTEFISIVTNFVNTSLDLITIDVINGFIDGLNSSIVKPLQKLSIKLAVAKYYNEVVDFKDTLVENIPSFPTICELDKAADFGVCLAWTVFLSIIILTTIGTVWEPLTALLSNVMELVALTNLKTSDSPTLPVQTTLSKANNSKPDFVIENKYTDSEEIDITMKSVQLQGDKENNTVVEELEIEGTQEKSRCSCSITLGSVLQCFAIQKNFPILLDTTTKGGQVLCLNGIRVISIGWVVLGHIYLIPLYAQAGDLAQANSKSRRLSFEIILNGFPSVDTFFLLSGFLVTYLLLKELAKGKPFQVLPFYLHRYIRLTIPFIVVMLIEGAIYPYYVKGPNSDTLQGNKQTCKDYWWTNLLYINNFIPWSGSGGICVGQTWYLSNDFQFFCLAPLFIFLLWKRPRIGVAVCSVCLCISMGISCALTAKYDIGSTTAQSGTIPGFSVFKDYYIKPYIRIVPYLVGILGGWVYSRNEGFIKSFDKSSVLLKTALGVPIWALTIAIEFSVVFAIHQNSAGVPFVFTKEKWSTIPYNTFGKLAWSVALMVQILACQAGLGGVINTFLSWRGWLPISRLTYSIYLLHYGLNMVLVAELRHSWSFQTDYQMVILYMGLMCMTNCVSAALYLTVEQPIKNLEYLTYRRPTPSSKTVNNGPTES